MKMLSPRMLVAALGAGALGLAAIFFVDKPESQPQQVVSAEKPGPSLNCVFYDFTRASVVVAFDFAATLSNGAPPRFEERAEAMRDGRQTTFDPGERPVWPFSNDDDGNPTIASPDGKTRIVLYGLKPGSAGTFFIEAGLRSNEFRNLSGQCQQANFGGVTEGTAKGNGPAVQ
jgi:hypothetical protein